MTQTTAPQPEPLPPEQAASLTEFARAAKAAARAVSLYPPTHPAIQGAMSRVVNAGSRLASGGGVTLVVHPDDLVIDGRAASRADGAIAELADLLHTRLIGQLSFDPAAEAADWLAFLLLLSRTPEELIAEGGIGKAWTLTGRTHFEIREIDYAEVLRERSGGKQAEWNRIIANCLQGESIDLDDRTISALLEVVEDSDRFAEFLAHLQESDGVEAKVGERAAALLRIIRGLMAALARQAPEKVDGMLRNVAEATAQLTPDMMLSFLEQATSPDSADGDAVGQVVERMNDRTIAEFVAGNIVAERGATGRLAQAFETLVPDAERRVEVLELAREDVSQSALGQESGFEELWQNASTMLMSYSDKPYVSADYARELSGARTQAIEVERVSDDSPERIQAWLSTVSDDSLRRLDLQLLLDLLRLENDAAAWRTISNVVVAEIERLTLLGEAQAAHTLLEPITRENGPEGRPQLAPAATSAIEKLAIGPLVRHVVLHLRKIDERDVPPFNALCHTLGPIVVRPLAEALAAEENNRALRRLREMLLGFGAAGRQSVEQLKSSANPAVRRTAIDLLRVFGGHEALPELTSMLDDADPQVQRESIRAIVQIGTPKAYAVLERALVEDVARRDTIIEQLLALREDKAIPLLCYVLNHTRPRGKLLESHLSIIDTLGGLGDNAAVTQTLKSLLLRGEWWAPFRTTALRTAAAVALRRIGSPDAVTVLKEAAASAPRRVRAIAKAQVAQVRATPARERARS